MRIGELARLSGFSASSIRYYERVGVLPPGPRLSSGYRDYSDTQVHYLLYLRKAKALGLSLEETRATLQQHADAACENLRGLLEGRMVEMQAMVDTLLARQSLVRRRLDETVEPSAPNVEAQGLGCDVIDGLVLRDGEGRLGEGDDLPPGWSPALARFDGRDD